MIKNSIIISLLFLLFSPQVYGQEYKWRIAPNSPEAGSRFNDASFINAYTGWVCSANNQAIYKTTNSGNSWFIVGNTLTTNRCIAFFDSLRGFTGEYNSSNRLNMTTNGGVTWSIVNIPFPATTGSCGFSVVNDSVLYGCGTYWGPARVIKTIDKGLTWQNIDMSMYTNGLVDCKFFTPDSGLVVGRAGVGSQTRGIVLSTADGGVNWDTVHLTTVALQWCWKIQFLNHTTGYISLEATGNPPHYYLKTTNRGLNWEEKIYSPTLNYDAEGIGFINENTGWVGGWSTYTNETTDGGLSWHLVDTSGMGTLMSNVNRIRFMGDTLAFAFGKRIYKYSKDIPTSVHNQNFVVNNFKLYQNYPNPFNPKTKIKLDLPVGTNVKITVHDILGKEVATIIEGDYLSAGTWEFEWDATNYPSGVYYYTVYNHDIGYTKSMLLVK